MDFLYFPENSAEYIPGLVWFVVGCIAAVLVTNLFKRISDKELQKAEHEEAKRIELESQGK
jgi:hypothetical protein